MVVDLQSATKMSHPAGAEFQQWVACALEAWDAVEVTVRLVDHDESAELNQVYRGKSGPTNVLAFAFESPVDLDIPILGDIVICAPVVADEASQQGKPIAHHWAHLTIHATLHLIGYDHEVPADAERMENKERELLEMLSIPDPYRYDHV
ncbi:MAG: rRNA maturation RNase YbeY [Pseudomonadota bacterium]